MTTLADYDSLVPAWCPGCGNFGILTSLKKAFLELAIEPHQAVIVSGIGQAGKIPHYIKTNVFNGLHGRPLPVAVGVKIANPELIVIAEGGDGDGYGEGGNHFLHTMRRNHDITYFVHNNQIYGLTKGQASPTSDFGMVTGTTPQGASNPIDPVALAVAAGASFVGRGFAGDGEHLTALMKEAITHKGFALVDILQPCVSFNHKNTFGWYRERVYHLNETPGYDPTNRLAAFEKALEWGDRIPIGIIYRKEEATYEAQIPALKSGSLVRKEINPRLVDSLLDSFL